jgi:bifunctional UDP-N-acetylglucosamine pyrophosphorylase/glucosamine-1-phosphate N-acetyltransferase
LNRVAVLLAAGNGRKFWPYNEVRNKCAFPIANEPMIARLARQLREIGFSRLVVVVGAEEGSIRAALRPTGEEGLLFVRQPGGMTPGTATAAVAALEAAGALTAESSALVVYGDIVVSTEDLRRVRLLQEEKALPAVALCAPLNGDRPQDWIAASLGNPRAGNGHTVGKIEGHSRGGSHRLAGVFAFGPPAWPYLRAVPDCMTHVPVGGMPAAEAELAEAVATMADDGLDTALLEASRPCADVDKPWHILEATQVVLREMGEAFEECRIDPSADVSDGAEIRGPVCIEAGATVGRRVVLEGPAWIGKEARVINGAIVGRGVMIGAGSRISDYCLVGGGAVIGRECVVGHGGEFSGVMLDRSYIYHYSEIYGVLGAAVDIGAATVCGTLRFDDADTVHRLNGRRETPRSGANAAFFGDYSRTGVNVITQPGVKIGAYSCVGPGIVLYNDVPSRKLVLLKQETVERAWGPERYGW